MSDPQTGRAARLRRANPFVMLVAGVLAGSLITAVAKEPGGGADVATTAGAAAPALASPNDAPMATVAPASGSGSVAVTPAPAATGGGGAPATTGTGSGGAAPSAAAGGRAAAATTSGGQCPGTGSTARGVTDTTVKIGFAIPDIRAFAIVFGEQVNPGDMAAHVRAVLAGMRKDKRLPVCGRDIVPVFREYNILDPAQSRAACVGFIDQDKVFMVVALFAFGAADCVAEEKRTPLFDLTGVETNLARTPYLFLMDPPAEVGWRATAHWLVQTGIAQGKKIGVYYNTSADYIKKDLVDELTKLGYPPAAVVTTDAATGTAADPNDAVAVQRFRVAGVNLAIPASGAANFYRQAKAQNYKPQWAVQGVALASDATTGQYPPDIFDGALGLLFDHVGEEKAGFPPSAEEKVCYRYWNESGQKTPPRDYGEGQTIRESCDQIHLVELALAATGRNLTADTFVRGMESIRDTKLAYYADATFASGKHYGPTKNVVQRYFQACACWKSTNNWQPLFSR